MTEPTLGEWWADLRARRAELEAAVEAQWRARPIIKGDQPHRPRYIYCSEPELCCLHYHPVVIECAVCGQSWPCAAKCSHHTEAQVTRLRRWVEGRRGRPARTDR
ncbi:hypothetical protein [Amycolatopsis sp. YIM 10]|uniref:hypothetical protein n=1 Tax=Amycolatopsis sp. YIM 10 TaxID=2653857 RepID=UPI001290138C|nr:hypothetical protein [Amycolatopsis sp. YIM 10]